MTGHGRIILQLSLVVGALYDLAFGLGILLAPGPLAGVLGLPLPPDQLYLRFLSVFLFGLALYYLLPAVDPERFRPVVWVAVAVRIMGFLFMATAWIFFSRPGIFLLLGAVDLAFAMAHGAGLLATRERHVTTPKS
ncbi:MAG: hypothetical protein E2P03_08820 [Acidobacteria bacterium]|nr:MAG: hypothetical protein E2P03_08820 [Acidobacteriota bacterium]